MEAGVAEPGPAECYQHPGIAAERACASCARPICGQCCEEVAGYPLCPPCLQAAQERIAAETAAQPAGSVPPATGAFGMPGAGAGAPPFQATPPYAEVPPPTTPAEWKQPGLGFADYLKALALAGPASFVGAYIWAKIVVLTGYDVTLFGIFLGIGVGMALRMGAGGRTGSLMPWFAVLITLLAGVSAYALMGHEVLAKETSENALAFKSIPIFIRFPILMVVAVQSMGVFGWACVGLGMWQSWRITSNR